MELKIYDSREEVARQFSKYFYHLTLSKDELHVALSGGSTPKIVFEELATHYKDRIHWEKVHLYWGDERCVPADDEESNFRMTRESLLEKINIPASNVHRIKGENEPEQEARSYGRLLEESLPNETGIPGFDLVILGMGEDGHTASIFPHQIELWDAPENCVVAIHPESGQKRVSITGKIINQATEVIFLVTGSGKSEKLREIMHQEGEYQQYPAALVAPKSENLLWYLDQDAAQDLELEE